MRGETTRTALNATIDVEEWPGAASRRFLLVHGSPGHRGHFAPLVPELERMGEVAAMDLPGYGRHRAEQAPSLEWHADLSAAIARDVWPGQRVDMVGHSFGGAVAITALVRHPDVVRSAIAIGCVGVRAHASQRQGARLARLPGARRLAAVMARGLGMSPLGVRAVAWFARDSFLPDAPPDEFVAHEMALLAQRPWQLATALAMNLGDPELALAAHARRVSAPTLLIHGRDDALVPIEHARELCELVPGASLVEVSGGHMVHYTRPTVVAAEIASWLAGANG